jgi:hypothetical protein
VAGFLKCSYYRVKVLHLLTTAAVVVVAVISFSGVQQIFIFRYTLFRLFCQWFRFVGNEVGGPISVVRAGADMAQYSPTALVGFAATLSGTRCND